MITKPTVLILGAGASSDYGFPLGRGLRDLVCRIPDTPGASAITDAGYDSEQLNEFVDILRHSAYTSVDWFLEDRPEFISIGKAAIAAALIPFENPDRLFPPDAPANHWYELLLNTLDSPRGSFTENRLSIVTFNYDRSLEYYLFRVLWTRLGSEERAAKALNSLDIIHVHGVLGRLSPLVADGRAYRPTLNPDNVCAAAKQIVVVGEASSETEAFIRARKVLGKAQKIVFLGFGFHQESVRRLELFNDPWDDERRNRVKVGGTSRGIPAYKWEQIRTDVLNQAFPSRKRQVEPVFRYLNDIDPLGT